MLKPLQLSIKINSSALIADIYPYLKRNYGAIELIDKKLDLTKLIFYEISERKGIVHLDESTKLSNLRDGQTIYGAEILNQRGKDKVQGYYKENQLVLDESIKDTQLLFFDERKSYLELPDLEEIRNLSIQNGNGTS